MYAINARVHFAKLYYAPSAACKLVRSGVAGIFGPQDKLKADYVRSMCDTLDIPYIAARWNSETKRDNVINLYPHPDMLSMVLIYIPNYLKII